MLGSAGPGLPAVNLTSLEAYYTFDDVDIDTVPSPDELSNLAPAAAGKAFRDALRVEQGGPVITTSLAGQVGQSNSTPGGQGSSNGAAWRIGNAGDGELDWTFTFINRLDGMAQFSISFWVKLAVVPTGTADRVVLGGQWNSPGNANATLLSIFKDGGNPVEVDFCTNGGGGNEIRCVSSPYPANTDWHHVVLVWDYLLGTGGNGLDRVNFYIDGVLASKRLRFANTGGPPPPQINKHSSFAFGGLIDASGNISTETSGGNGANGSQFDELSMWSRPFTQTDVDAVYARGVAGQRIL